VDWKALISFEETIFKGYSVVASTTQIECDTFTTLSNLLHQQREAVYKPLS
jgi:hypothetical protein